MSVGTISHVVRNPRLRSCFSDGSVDGDAALRAGDDGLSDTGHALRQFNPTVVGVRRVHDRLAGARRQGDSRSRIVFAAASSETSPAITWRDWRGLTTTVGRVHIDVPSSNYGA